MTEQIDRLGNSLGYDRSKEKIELNLETETMFIYSNGEPVVPITQEIAERIKKVQREYPIFNQHKNISPYEAYQSILKQDKKQI